ncbi:flagellar assembly protein FliH [Oxalobacteraceae bacterium GrIS 1.11]
MSDLPKEQQSAYQRWEMTSFGDDRPSAVAARTPAPTPAEAGAALEYPTQDELDAIRAQAREQAHAEGLATGHAEGHADGRAEALALGAVASAVELEHVRSLAAAFGEALAEADQLIANEVLDLALQLAKGMLKNALQIKPELILPIVREAIEYLPVLQQPALLMLNPADAQVVREGIGEELDKGGWRVLEDASIERGGCKVDTASNQIDAQTSSRWQRLTHALGKDVDWLAP